MRSSGFTLIDLIISLSIVSILLGVGAPNLFNQIQKNRVETAKQSLLESLDLTRTYAVFSNNRATIRKQNDTWEGGWEIFVDANNDGNPTDDEKTIQKHEKLSGVRITTNTYISDYISYTESGESRNANGTNSAGAFQAGTFKICPLGKGKGYKLVLSRGGRVRQQEISAKDCAAL